MVGLNAWKMFLCVFQHVDLGMLNSLQFREIPTMLIENIPSDTTGIFGFVELILFVRFRVPQPCASVSQLHVVLRRPQTKTRPWIS